MAKPEAVKVVEATNVIKATKDHFDLAALLYYDATKKDKEAVQFEKLDAEEQAPYIRTAVVVYQSLSKMNKMVVKYVSTEDAEKDFTKHHNRLCEIIREFLKGVNKPKGVAQMFPVEELSHRILKGGVNG